MKKNTTPKSSEQILRENYPDIFSVKDHMSGMLPDHTLYNLVKTEHHSFLKDYLARQKKSKTIRKNKISHPNSGKLDFKGMGL